MQLIFGANGPSGRAFIRTLTNPADTIAVLRKPSEDSFFSEHHIQTTIADALDADALDKVFAQYRPDSVISFVGGKNEQGIRSDALGNINIIAAAQAANPQARFILITSMGCGERNLPQTKQPELDHPPPLRPRRRRQRQLQPDPATRRYPQKIHDSERTCRRRFCRHPQPRQHR